MEDIPSAVSMWNKLANMDYLQLLSDIISIFTITSSLFLKVPQIMTIKRKKSTVGIYIEAMLMEITSYSITMLYNYTNEYSLMTYLEYPVILIQLYILFYYTLKFKNMLRKSKVALMTIMYWGIMIGFVVEFIPKNLLKYMVLFCTPLSSFSKITYIYGILKVRNANAVSLTTWAISALTNVARIFTVYMDSADIHLLLNFTLSSLLSFGVFMAAFVYQTKSKLSKAKLKLTQKID